MLGPSTLRAGGRLGVWGLSSPAVELSTPEGKPVQDQPPAWLMGPLVALALFTNGPGTLYISDIFKAVFSINLSV